MFPFCNTIYISSTIIGIYITLKVYFAWREEKNELLGYLFKTALLATAYFLLSSIPGVLTKDPTLSEIFYILGWIPFYLTFFYFSRLTIYFWKLDKLKKFLSAIIIFFVLFTTFFSFYYFTPAEIRNHNNFSFCYERSPSWNLTLSGTMVTILLLSNSFMFLLGGSKSKEVGVRKRAFLIGMGLFLLAFSSFAKYVLAPNWRETEVLIFMAGPFLLIGVVMIYLGIQQNINKAK
jgi:hypothetical protein